MLIFQTRGVSVPEWSCNNTFFLQHNTASWLYSSWPESDPEEGGVPGELCMVTGRLPQVVTELRSGLYMMAKNEMDLQTHLSKIWTNGRSLHRKVVWIVWILTNYKISNRWQIWANVWQNLNFVWFVPLNICVVRVCRFQTFPYVFEQFLSFQKVIWIISI